MNDWQAGLVFLLFGILAVAIMNVVGIWLIEFKREQNNSAREAYLWASYAIGYRDMIRCKVRRESPEGNEGEALTVRGFCYYNEGYDDARDGKPARSKAWLTGATEYKKEVFHKIMLIEDISDDL